MPTIKAPVNLNRVSLQLVQREERGTYHVQFLFDSTVPCGIRIFFFCDKESKLPTDVPCYNFEAGLGQAFVTNEEYYLNTNDKTEDEMKEFIENGQYPVIITIEPVTGEEPDNSKEKKIVSQITYAALLDCTDSFVIKPMEQKIIYGSVSYVVHDIYGIDHTSTAPPDECVICMTEMRDTVVIPCRHLCVCHQCAQALHYQSNKCPICRGVVRSMIKIKLNKSDEKIINSDSDSDEKKKDEPLLKKKKKSVVVIDIPDDTEILT